MSRQRNDYRYSRFSTLNEVLAEKARLHRKIKKQEKILAHDWERIEESWQILVKITQTGSRLFSSSILMQGIELGYNFILNFFSKKK